MLIKLLLSLVCGLTFTFARANEAPFWKSKGKIYERIQNREIIVGVRSDVLPGESPKNKLAIDGGGQVHAPRDFVLEVAQKYADLPKISDCIRSAQYDALKHQLDLELETFTYKAKMQIEVQPATQEEPRKIAYRVVAGPLTGFSGVFTFAVLNSTKSEVGMAGEFKYDHFPLPGFFLRFGFEVVFQKIAARLRAYVEEKWQDKNPHL